nr:YbdK family carboxylate-amine ligase [Brevibacterium daeguense]
MQYWSVNTQFGIEEEFLLVAQHTGSPATPTPEQSAGLLAIDAGGCTLSREWLSCQIEHGTPVLTEGGTALEALQAVRGAVAETVTGFGMSAVPLGTSPLLPDAGSAISADARYQHLAQLLPAIAADQYINGMHVHVAIPDREAGVRALNGLRPWYPVLTALGANSPLWRGSDSGFASWRSIHYRRWMITGIPPLFADAADHDARVSALLTSDAAEGPAFIGWLGRLSHRHPTIEIRTCDVQLTAADAAAIALLTRALVTAGMEGALAGPDSEVPGAAADVTRAGSPWTPELLDLAHWQAAQLGLTGRLLDPVTAASVPAVEAAERALTAAQPFFADRQEERFVRAAIARLCSTGGGAGRQRRALARGGVPAVLEDAVRLLTESDPVTELGSAGSPDRDSD